MFGADTALVMDALAMAALAATGGAALVFAALRRRRAVRSTQGHDAGKRGLEARVEVLERIATDRSIDLAEEIEALRSPAADTLPDTRTKGKA